MNSKEREALKMALVALERVNTVDDDCDILSFELANFVVDTIDAIKEALSTDVQAQPEQEPVAWIDINEKGAASGLRYWSEPENRHEVALYTTPSPVGFAVMQKPWVGLTDDEREDIATEYGLEWLAYRSAFKEVEAILKEKNA